MRSCDLFLLSAGLLAGTTANAQGWMGKYSPDRMMAINGIQERPDGELLITGFALNSGDTTRVMRLASDGTPLGAIDIPGITSVTYAEPMASGGFVLVGSRPNSEWEENIRVLVRVGGDGHPLWSADIDTFPSPQGGGILGNMDIVATPDGGYLCLLHPHDPGLARHTITVKRLDETGGILWENSYFTDRPSAYCLRMSVTPDGGAVLGLHDPAQSQGSLFKIDMDGELVWTHDPSETMRYLTPMASAAGNILAFAPLDDGSSGLLLMELDQSGSLLWSRTYPALDGGLSLGYLMETDDGYAGIGMLFQGLRTDLAFVRLNDAGDILLQQPIPTANLGLGLNRLLMTQNTMIRTQDGGFLFGGWIEENASFSHSGFLVRTDAEGRVYPRLVSGTAFGESDGNCEPDAGEPVLNGTIIEFANAAETLHVAVRNGFYTLGLGSGTYTVQAKPVSPYWEAAACNTGTIQPAADGDTTLHVAFTPLVGQPYVRMDGHLRNRMCAANTYTMRYCNNGTEPYSGVLLLTFDDLLTVDSASTTWDWNTNNVVVFAESSLPVGECRTLHVHFTSPCDLELMGRTLCIEARALPDHMVPTEAWDQAHLTVTALHDEMLGEVVFTVHNTGSGDMTQARDLVIHADHEEFEQLPVQLPSQGQLEHRVPANGSTWRGTIRQTTGDPYAAFATTAIEGAGTNDQGDISLGFVDDFPLSGAFAFQHMACAPLVNSYDPNRKLVQPEGAGPERHVDSTAVLDYTIDFQNTGTAEAYVVRIVDTLATTLDPATIVPGASSHPYLFRFLGPRVVEFLFENINLPDSTSNEPESHGFVRFRIHQAKGAVVGTRIENEVGIYFDHNPPVITDPVTVTVGWPKVTHVEQLRNGTTLEVFPNPFDQWTTVLVKGERHPELGLVMRDAAGREVRRYRGSHTDRLEVSAAGLRAGAYMIEVYDKHSVIGRLHVVIY